MEESRESPPIETHKTPAEPSQRANADTENSSITSYYSPQVHISPHQLDMHAGERFTTFRLMSPSCVRLGPAVHPPKTHTRSKKNYKKQPQVGPFSLARVATASLPYELCMQVFGSAVNKKKKKVFCCCSERAPLIYACQG